MTQRLAPLLLCLVALIAASPSLAQDRANGELIAKTWCAGCHNVDGASPQFGQTDAIPSFSAVAGMPSTTATSLRVFLSTPHARMPDYNLTQTEIADVAEYILSLKK
ncbi:MAG: cytochrome c [Alphaproteobacteria bacterium]|nr:cytochrome c [Alphaproteobacteria bacterium]